MLYLNKSNEGRLGVPGNRGTCIMYPGNRGTWPKLKRNKGTWGLIQGSGKLLAWKLFQGLRNGKRNA